MKYLKTFVISAPLFALFFHWIATEPMPWWPDTAIMGAFMGALASFVLLRLHSVPETVGHLWRAGRFAIRAKR